tara:strand:- start:83 stop:205 length:123 start_codon:yes stop_codon:yes gene_type:complete
MFSVKRQRTAFVSTIVLAALIPRATHPVLSVQPAQTTVKV